MIFQIGIFRLILVIDSSGISCKIALIGLSLDLPDKKSGNKPLPGPMMTQLYVAIWRHQATKSYPCKHHSQFQNTYQRKYLFGIKLTLNMASTTVNHEHGVYNYAYINLG